MQAENEIYLKHILTLILIKQSILENFNTCNKNVLPHAIMKLCIHIHHIYIGYIFLKVNTFIVFDQKTFNYENQINLQRVNTISCILFLLIYSFYSWLLNSYLFDSFPLFFFLKSYYVYRYIIYAETCYIIKLHEHETKKQIVIHTTNNIHSKLNIDLFLLFSIYRNI